MEMFIIAIVLNLVIGLMFFFEEKRENLNPTKFEWISILGVLLFFSYSLKSLMHSHSGKAIAYLIIFFSIYLLVNILCFILLKIRKKPAFKVYLTSTVILFFVFIFMAFFEI
jgi:hypothetical protein